MPIDESYRDKTFKVADKDCRIRNDDLVTFATYKAGDALRGAPRSAISSGFPSGQTSRSPR